MNVAPIKPTDFATDQEVRWCPGCGDYAILKAMQKLMAELRAPTEKTVFVSGIGCSSRFPYYMSTYGFHTIHGRAPAVATGIKLANPELDVWIVTGDGDGLSIGGNHLYHALRRNLDCQILLFNNEIYGLTKGQYSPTSRPGLKTPSTPQGSVDHPVSPCAFALGSGAHFIARAIDTQQKPLMEVLRRARSHDGAAFIEIFQNCPVYNDDVFSDFSDKRVAPDRQLHLEHAAPMIFGKNRDKGLRLNSRSLSLEVVTIGDGGMSAEDILVHDETNRNLAALLIALSRDEFPMPLGVIYASSEQTFAEGVFQSYRVHPKGMRGADFAERLTDIKSLLRGEQVWTVK